MKNWKFDVILLYVIWVYLKADSEYLCTYLKCIAHIIVWSLHFLSTTDLCVCGALKARLLFFKEYKVMLVKIWLKRISFGLRSDLYLSNNHSKAKLSW